MTTARERLLVQMLLTATTVDRDLSWEQLKNRMAVYMEKIGPLQDGELDALAPKTIGELFGADQ